ncbi:uncharacterized protein LOC132198970 [Neocloeon triangulifer]|uniref:uncharacterized protein LOC132198970 n=1 Tax=Neocloeon triangulifer TaxID=2078957 RepID=UPI00286F52A9|nr:uncharacterized protein LOC132198970 [Neocloeon triangulifer]XP_059479306.1 uncharacterized protein LOC132198970 [Neocloeon triangulifer]
MVPSKVIVLLALITCSCVYAAPQGRQSRLQQRQQDADDEPVADDTTGSTDLEELENEIAEAAAANLAARAIKLEQRLEDEILEAAVLNLKDPDVDRRQRRMQELGEMVKRDKRTVQAITGLLGASSSAAGTFAQGAGQASLTLAQGAGTAAVSAAQDIAARGSSATALVGSLISSVLGASSSAASGTATAIGSRVLGIGGAADPNAAPADPAAGGAFSPLRLLSDSVSAVLRVKFSIFRTLFSLVSGVAASSSSAASGASGAAA